MPDSDRVSIDNLTTAPSLDSADVMPVVHEVSGVKSTYKTTLTDVSSFANKELQYSSDLHTTSKTIIGAINELEAGGGGGGSSTFAGLTDVDIDNLTLANGQVPVYNSTTQKWENEDQTGGHTIVNDAGTSLSQEPSLQFKGAYSVDDSGNTKTIVNVVRSMTRAQFDQLSADEKTGFIQITDEGGISASDVSGLATVATSGSYNDLTNKPTIPAAQVNSDWNAASGVAQILNKPSVYTQTQVDNKITAVTPLVYNRNDVLLNTLNGTLRGFGSAMVTLCGGIARIDFNLKISVDETGTGATTFGINRDYFTELTGKTISPIAGGVVTYYNNEQIYANRVDFGGTFLQNGQFWQPARVYDDNGTKKVGGWSSQNFASGQRMIGTCYGTYT